MTDRLRALQVFVRVVENGSFSATAKEFALGQASISKQIGELEAQLRTKLMARTTRRLSLTETGEKFYHHAKSILEQYDFALGDVQNLKQRPAGNVRLASPILFGRKYITPALRQFIERYPDITIEHYMSDSSTDLVLEGIDVSIRTGEMSDSSYVARKLASFRYVTVASTYFVEKYGAPQHPSELERLPCVIYLNLETPFRWEYVARNGRAISVRVTGPYRANATDAVRAAAVAGLGVMRAPTSAVASELESGQLVRVLCGYDSALSPVHAVIPAAAYVPHKTRVLIDFLHAEFKRNPLLKDF